MSFDGQPNIGELDFEIEQASSAATSAQHFRAIRSFVPDYLVSYLDANIKDNVQMQPHSTAYDGVCVIIDISGFTRLSGSFCALGKEGIDGLQKIVNGYMGSLVRQVYEYGGDVIKFAGDALICIFMTPENIRDELKNLQSSISAVQLAWKLKDECTEALTLHIGIAYGEICFGVLGGNENKWDCLISGKCLGELSSCLDDAPSKHVALTGRAKDYFAKMLSKHTEIGRRFSIDGETLETGNYLLKSVKAGGGTLPAPLGYLLKRSKDGQRDPDTLIAQISTFVPAPVSQALLAGTFTFLAELREVTTVFMKWDGYNEDEHRDLLTLQKYFFTAQEIISNAGGFMRQFLVDDKGCVLIAMWGVPAAAFPDNSLRALWTAVTTASKFRSMNMPCSCGITTGNVYCGTVGSSLRQEYAAVGDVVNLSARLMGKAKGGIFIDEASYRRLPDIVQAKLEVMDEMKVKGKDVPIRPYRYKKDAEEFDFKDISYSADSFPIRSACKDSFVVLLSYLLANSAVAQKSKMFLNGNVGIPDSGVLFLVIEGPTGTGRGRALSWLKHTAVQSELKTITINMGRIDAVVDYLAITKLFRLFVGEERYDDINKQTAMVNTFLNELYPDDWETIAKVAYPAMRIALGITAPLRVRSKSMRSTLIRTDTSRLRIPPRLVLMVLSDIFKLLIIQGPVLILIENVQYVDACSWRVLQEFVEFPGKAAVVMSSGPLSRSAEGLKAHTLLEDVFAAGTNVSYDWVEPNVCRLLQNECARHIRLNTYTFPEVRIYLAHSLKTMATFLPKGLDRLVFQLSGGHPLWVSEICTFIKANGVQEFLNTMNTGEKVDEPWRPRGVASVDIPGSGIAASASRTTITAPLGSTDQSANNLSSATNDSDASKRPSMDGRSSAIHPAPPLSPKNLTDTSASAGEQKDVVDKSTSFQVKNITNYEFLYTKNEATKSKRSLNPAANNKLAFLIVCRFANLPPDQQSVARSASIIGIEFTEDVLMSIVPQKMALKVPAILSALVQANWLSAQLSTRQLNARDTEEIILYLFVHPMVHKTIYDLTPLSVRKTVHQEIARHLEGKITKDATIDSLMNLGHHYSESEDAEKALEFLAKAALKSASYPDSNIPSCIKLIIQASHFIRYTADVNALLGVVTEGIKSLEKEEIRSKELGGNCSPILAKFRGRKISSDVDAKSSELMMTLGRLENDLLDIEEEISCNYEAEASNPTPLAEWQEHMIMIRKREYMQRAKTQSHLHGRNGHSSSSFGPSVKHSLHLMRESIIPASMVKEAGSWSPTKVPHAGQTGGQPLIQSPLASHKSSVRSSSRLGNHSNVTSTAAGVESAKKEVTGSHRIVGHGNTDVSQRRRSLIPPGRYSQKSEQFDDSRLKSSNKGVDFFMSSQKEKYESSMSQRFNDFQRDSTVSGNASHHLRDSSAENSVILIGKRPSDLITIDRESRGSTVHPMNAVEWAFSSFDAKTPKTDGAFESDVLLDSSVSKWEETPSTDKPKSYIPYAAATTVGPE